ncbi:MAG: pentapeptide repeat-containing protein [Leptolyngbyaceae cyanobacterium RU_5_1]|nr:pentapeptide repeat-containing protein [Leptolyngbyaceae cyanobacterium RU_5_1]
MQAQELLEQYRQGERDFSHVDLSGANLSGFNLRGVDFTGANLTEANLSWTFLNQANLTGACLQQANLRSASLSAAKLNRANLSRANLSKIDLRLAYLQESNLNWAILQEADMGGANLEAAKLDQVNLERAKLNSAYLVGAELMEANLRRANLASAKLDQANLREARLEEANLREATLVGANLIEANLSGAYLRQANLTEADLHRVILSGADLSEAILSSADLSRANIAGAYLLKASFSKAHLLRANLQDVYLLHADLSEANLRGADLQRADLSGAYLRHAILSEANLNGAYLLESHLIHTNLDGAQMTGCCIYNWHVEDLDFSKVQCRYVFTQFNYTTKTPCDRYPSGRDFEAGELGKRYQEEDSSVVELYFTEPLNWEVMVFTLAQVEVEEPDLSLTIKSYAAIEDNYLVRIGVSRVVNSKTLIRRIFQLYPEIRQRLLTRRGDVLRLLGIANPLGQPEIPHFSSSTNQGLPPSLSSVDQQVRIYKDITRQVQHILVTQAPDLFMDSVQQLLKYLDREGIATEDLQRKVIAQAIAQRAQRDRGFKTHLLNWEMNVSKTARLSIIGQAIRMAIVVLKNGQARQKE